MMNETRMSLLPLGTADYIAVGQVNTNVEDANPNGGFHSSAKAINHRLDCTVSRAAKYLCTFKAVAYFGCRMYVVYLPAHWTFAWHKLKSQAD